MMCREIAGARLLFLCAVFNCYVLSFEYFAWVVVRE